MKNSKVKSILFSLILIASVGSYAYINSVDVEQPHVNCQMKNTLIQEDNKSDSELPDVKIFKKIIENGKKILPASVKL